MNIADGKSWPTIYRPHSPITAWDFDNSTHDDPVKNGHTFPVQYCGTNESVAMICPYNGGQSRYDWPIFILDLPHTAPVNAQTSIVWGHEFGKVFTACDEDKTPDNTANIGFEFIMTAQRLWMRGTDGVVVSVDLDTDWTDSFVALNDVIETAWSVYPEGGRRHNAVGVECTADGHFNVETWVYQYQGGVQPVQLLGNLSLNNELPVPTGPMIVVGMGEPPVARPGDRRENCWRPRIVCCGLDS